MTDQDAIEIRAEDIEAAIEEGLRRLGLSRAEVQIEVVDEGRKGFLGLGGRDAVVRLRPQQPQTAVARPEPETAIEDAIESLAEPMPSIPPVSELLETDEDEDEDDALPPDEAEDGAVAVDIVRQLLDHMGIEADLELSMSEPDDISGRQMLVVNVVGGDLQDLIGAHGEVLADLQYLARLMAGHALQRRADFLIDVAGYREQRRQALSSLAQRMAQKAVQRGRPVTLEPMSPYDRRIIHITLRENEAVYTQSTGEGSRRRVRIYPKE